MLTGAAVETVAGCESRLDGHARMIVGRNQAEIQRKVMQPVVDGVPVAFCIPSRSRPEKIMQSEHGYIDRQRICILAQWDAPYTDNARNWKRHVNAIGSVRDLCADQYIRDKALTAVSGAGLVVYFGHASSVGFDGYHGVALEDMRLRQPIGVIVSWSCNAIFGRSAFGIRLVQKGLVRAFIGTKDSAAKTSDNAALAQIAAESLVTDQPSTVGHWMVAIDKAVAKLGDQSLTLAWHKFRVVGNIDEPLPMALEPTL